MNTPRWLPLAFFAVTVPCLGLDQNTNQQSDVWEMVFGVAGLAAAGDADGDGWSNAVESAAGTDPKNAASFPGVHLESDGVSLFAAWTGLAGKKYTLQTKPSLAPGSWTDLAPTVTGAGGPAALELTLGGALTGFFRLRAEDQDSDLDGIKDWEELAIGFDPTRNRTDRSSQLDIDRVPPGLIAANTITVSVYDDTCSERWPDPAVIAVRRTGGLQPLTVNVSLTTGSTATRGTDYTASIPANAVSFGPGVREVFVEIAGISDANDGEATETITLTALAGAGYTVGAPNAGSVSLLNETAVSGPSAKEAARFLIQAAFGPNQDSPADPDHVPENVKTLMDLGFSQWIADQFTRPIGYIQPWVDWADQYASALQLHGNWKEFSWWGRAMGSPYLRPDVQTPVAPDPLRQRVAFALSEIIVASDRPEAFAGQQRGSANFYDLFEQHAFGNYRDLLQEVARHPVMGIYLSHLGNQKANPATNVFPDENFAREIMQLFSIGLWELNPDGTRQLDAQGQPIATYDNGDITELARVFTGLSFGNNTEFALYPRDFKVPMKGWDAFHDLGPKTLLGGLQLPARTASPGNTGTATMADVTAAVDNLFNHPNVGPFLALRLIQRFVTSNPSSGYVGRVAAAFADNGAGVRGDMKAVVSAILLDVEARDPAMMSQPAWGKLREPFLRCVNFANAFDAKSPDGYYPLDQFALAHLQDPMNAPSVFNFFLPTHSPPGALAQQGLVAPEFQIINAASAVSGANYFWNHINSDLHYWGTANPNYAVRLNLDAELAMVTSGNVNADVPTGALDPDPLLRRLDLALTGGTLSSRQFQIIREAMLRVGPPSWQWHRERVRLAIYCITTSADFNVLR